MTCDCPKTGTLFILMIIVTCTYLYNVIVCISESESLHADVREGRLISSADDRKFGPDREERNPPSNGKFLTHTDRHTNVITVCIILAIVRAYLHCIHVHTLWPKNLAGN